MLTLVFHRKEEIERTDTNNRINIQQIDILFYEYTKIIHERSASGSYSVIIPGECSRHPAGIVTLSRG